MTKNCNFRCTYCYEVDNYVNNKLTIDNCKKIIKFIDNLKNSDFLRQNKFDSIWITFFGGEPTLNYSALKYIVNYYKNDDFILFSLITNGSKEDVIKDVFDEVKTKMIGNTRKLHVQVSYDGQPIHDKNRIDINRKPTSAIVKKTITNLILNGYNVSIKSTITPDDFKYMYDAYLDVKSIFEEPYGSYFPTIDYYNTYEIDYNIEDLKQSLIKISAEEYKYFKQYKKFFFSWFNGNNNKVCGAGQGMIAIDTDLKVYPCHGAFFENNNEHLIGHLEKHDIINKINNRRTLLQTALKRLNTCNFCNSNICLKCNVIKHKYSDKEEYTDKWYDFENQPWLCRYYKVADKIKLALLKISEV
jgi:uncharacterized protein